MNYTESLQHLIENNQLEEAENQARQLLQESPDSLDLKMVLARILLIQERNDDAIPLLEYVAKQDSQNYYPLYLLAIIKERKELFDEAIDLHTQALKLNPNNGKFTTASDQYISTSKTKIKTNNQRYTILGKL